MASKPSFSTAVATNDGQACGRTGNAQLRTAKNRDDEPADDPGNDPRKGRRAGSDGNAKTQWHRDEKHHDPRRNVVIKVAEIIVEMPPKHA